MACLCFIEVKIKYTYIVFLQINEREKYFFLQLVNNEKAILCKTSL